MTAFGIENDHFDLDRLDHDSIINKADPTNCRIRSEWYLCQPLCVKADALIQCVSTQESRNYLSHSYHKVAALLADRMATVLDITAKWKVFEQMWQRKNMRNDYNTAPKLVSHLFVPLNCVLRYSR